MVALHDRTLMEMDRSLYTSVCDLVGDRIPNSPVIFWRNWRQTPGKQLVRLIGKHRRMRFERFMNTDVNGKHVVFVETPRPTTPYLLEGIAAAKGAGASSIGVITHRRMFSVEDLKRLRKSGMTWMLVSDRLTDIQPGIERICPGKIFPFPYVRSRTSHGVDPFLGQPLMCTR
jgi:hypothetical protein